jgi:hypothetical protein
MTGPFTGQEGPVITLSLKGIIKFLKSKLGKETTKNKV